jgi:predicted CopG family antitoxin
MSKIVSLRLNDDIYMALERLKSEAGEKAVTNTIKRFIIESMNRNKSDQYHSEVLDRLARIESNTVVLKSVEFTY